MWKEQESTVTVCVRHKGHKQEGTSIEMIEHLPFMLCMI